MWLSTEVDAWLAALPVRPLKGDNRPLDAARGMASPEAVRPAPAMTGNGPRKSDQRGGVIGHEATSATADVQTPLMEYVADAIEQTARFYRRSALAQSSDYLEVWLEKDALAGVLWDVTSDYDVPLMVSRGMPSLTFLHGSAQAIQRAAEEGKQAFIYQFGDHDPSGVLIPRSIERRLAEMCERLECPPPHVERVALASVVHVA